MTEINAALSSSLLGTSGVPCEPCTCLENVEFLSLPHLSRGREMLQSTQQHLPSPSLFFHTHTLTHILAEDGLKITGL